MIYLYKNGNFESVKDPIKFDGDWEKNLKEAGYSISHKFPSDDLYFPPDLEIYSVKNMQRDVDYPYFVYVNICNEGHVCAIEKWYDLCDFLTKYCGWVNMISLDDTRRAKWRLDSENDC